MIKFHFYRSTWRLPFTKIISRKTNSDYAHCAMEICGLKEPLYQSRLHTGLNKNKHHHTHPSYTIELPFDRESDRGKLFIRHMEELVGSKYDIIAAIFGFFGKKIQIDNRYICSEVLFEYFKVYKEKIPDLNTNYSPKDIILISFGFEIG